MTKPAVFKMVAVADLHFGHPKIPSEDLYAKLRTYLYPELNDAHMVVICGDLYDQLLTVNSTAHKCASLFMADLFRMSACTGLEVRLLHGTYTHDRDQLDIFHAIKVPNARYRIVNNIEVEEIKSFYANGEELKMPFRIGYLPDNLSFKESSDAVAYLKQNMSCKCFPVLDCIIGHGTFAHAIAPDSGHKPPCLYHMDQFEEIVPRGPIVMGHLHAPGRTKNIFYCGSFDRLAHGEEHCKGFYVFTKLVEDPSGWKSRFVENPVATKFISIHPTSIELVDASHEFTRQVENYFPNKKGFVRVVHKSTDVRTFLHKVCSSQFPTLVYSSKSTGEKEVTTFAIEDIKLDIFDDVAPNEANLGDLVYKFLSENNMCDGVDQAEIIAKTKTLVTTY